MSDRAGAVEVPLQAQALGRNFRLYAFSRAVSVVGDRVATIALVFLILHLAHSPALGISLFYLSQVLPNLFFGLLVGVAADHFDRRRLMVACDLARAGLLAVVPVLTALQLWTIYPVVFVLYALTLLFDVSAQSALPDVVAESRMTSANATLQGIANVADVAYAVGGALVLVLGFEAPFYIDAATFVVSAILVAAMRVPSHPRGPWPDVGEVLTRIKLGASYLAGQPFLRWSTIAFALGALGGGAMWVLTPLYAANVLGHSPGLFGPFHNGAFRFSTLEVCLGLGALLGSVSAPVLAHRWPRGLLYGLGLAGAGVAAAGLGFAANFYVAAALVFDFGFCNTLFLISGVTLVQKLTPTDVRGRVVAARRTASVAALSLGSLAGGGLLFVFSYTEAWVAIGAVIAASSLLVLGRPEVRRQA